MMEAPTDATTYAGGELELFCHAHNWKRYWQSKLQCYVRGDVMEVGAGIGANIPFLKSGAKSFLALEPDATQAAAIGSSYHDGSVRVLAKTVSQIRWKFDAIFYIDVLEHIRHDRQELEAAYAHLNPGGVIVVLAPAYPFLFSKFDESIGHFRRYTKESLIAIRPQGAQVNKAFYLDAVGCAASFMNKLVLKQSLPTLRQIKFWDRALVPLSKLCDPICTYFFGKTVIVVFEKPMPGGTS